MRLVFVCLAILCTSANAWDSEQLEVFDVVDEVKENFYHLLNISQDATNQEIKSAFRGLSLKLHPDKNPGVDTSVQFRNLVSVYEVLRSPSKRQYYDEVLVKGLPNWRSAVYYYRYVRKMGIAEVCVILFVIVSIGQYLVNWASYFEKRYTLEQNRKFVSGRRKKLLENNGTTEPNLDDLLPKPTVSNTLPVQIPKLVWYIVASVPQIVVWFKNLLVEQIEEMRRKKPAPQQPETAEDASENVPRIKTVRKRNKGFVMPEGPNFQPAITTPLSSQNYQSNYTGGGGSSMPPPVTSGGLWTDDDIADLTKLMKKFPSGTLKRWEVIAEHMQRSVPEITYMANKLKENICKVASEDGDGQAEVPMKVKQKTKKDALNLADSGVEDAVKKWSQVQQRALEDALAKYTKGCTDRWDRIADCVPNKTKEECMLRFRYLAETLKKQKEAASEQQQPQPPD